MSQDGAQVATLTAGVTAAHGLRRTDQTDAVSGLLAVSRGKVPGDHDA